MGVSAFAVLLHDDETESKEELTRRIEEAYPGDKHFKFSDGVYIVTGPRLVDDVAKTLGLHDEADRFGVVLRLNGSFSGRSWTNLWDWLRAADQTP